ncbi:RhoGAP_domain-containing protein [Hexamita inflata]|uniref:RhoGAP domain-containing protein n=1 Tax=Hexamita inflata TaxID=28002 RepID=A0AA86R7S8_9EUKA|nr:RhoGAP domain-containing protein [Hexamita inflata]
MKIDIDRDIENKASNSYNLDNKLYSIPHFITNAFIELQQRTPQAGIFKITQSFNQQELNRQIDLHFYVDPAPLETDQICSLIKYFYRKLTVPLLPKHVCKQLREHAQNPMLMKTDLVFLKPSYFENLVFLLKKLNGIAKVPEYRMDAKNLGVCFAPNLFEDFAFGDEKILQQLIVLVENM